MNRALFSILFFSICAGLSAESYQTVMDGPIHEAFIVREAGSLLLEAAPYAPPPKITELATCQKDAQAIWIPGYWAWSSQHRVFLWVSGVWRRPPPGMHWVRGHWKNYPEGWVYISGFWTSENPEKLKYLKIPPPSTMDQRVSSPPSATSGKYFWVPGYWKYDPEKRHYIWYAGRWDLMDNYWVFCPAQYIWRELGYVFIPGFWDWPLPLRGAVFPAIYVNGESLEILSYEPSGNLDPLFVMELMFPYWPDYLLFYLYHYNHYYQAWSTWGAAPPWWDWPAWAGFPRSAQWALWWWWTHPGYAHPEWLTPSIAQSIRPAPNFVKKMMQNIKPPAIVTSNGVVNESTLYEALTQISRFTFPILPSNPKQIRQIQKVVSPVRQSKDKVLTPGGKEQGNAQSPEKPFIGPSVETLRSPPRRATLPPLPVTQEDLSQEKLTPNMPARTPPPHPIYQPMPQIPYNSPFEQPRQGYQIEYEYPQAPMQTQHLNRIMGSPQFQENPPGPKVHQVPGDYSTLPGL